MTIQLTEAKDGIILTLGGDPPMVFTGVTRFVIEAVNVNPFNTKWDSVAVTYDRAAGDQVKVALESEAARKKAAPHEG